MSACVQQGKDAQRDEDQEAAVGMLSDQENECDLSLECSSPLPG